MNRVIQGVNDLATVRPDLAKQWDAEANAPLTPQDFTTHSHEKVYWRCSRNPKHTWQATVYNRTRGTECPYCVGIKPFVGETDLGSVNPLLANQWDYGANAPLTPQDVTAFSGKKVYWRCSRNPKHIWQATVYNRSNGTECPYCAGIKPFVGETDLRSVNPLLASQWDYEANAPLTPQDVTAFSRKKVYWRCSRNPNHTWQATVYNRTNGTGCPYCAGQIPFVGETDLGTLNPFLASQWDYGANAPLTPQDVTAFSNKIIYWRCSRNPNHTWQATVNDRTNGRGCPYCAGHKPFVGETDLGTLNPFLASQWDYGANAPFTPQDVTAFSRKKVYWRCSNNPNHIWQATVSGRSSGAGCPYCSHKVVFNGETDLLSVCPALAEEWDYEANAPLRPQEVLAYSKQKVHWRCSRNPQHTWFTTVHTRANGSGCPYCTRSRPWVGETDLATTNPNLAKEWDYEANAPITPQDVVEGSTYTAWWRCGNDSDHKWSAKIAVRSKGAGCPFCSHNRPFPGKTDLETVNPELAVQWDKEKNAPLSARDVAAQSSKKVWWVCTQNTNHRWQARVSGRARGSGCPYCAGNLPWVGETDLGAVDPELSKQWDYEVNAPLTPQDVTAHSGKKVGWICPENPEHKWRATVNDRVSGSGCPYCNNNRKPVKRRLS